MKLAAKIVMWALAIILIWPMFKPLAKKDESAEGILGQMVVQAGGRAKPFDSVAREYLLIFRGKQTVSIKGEGRIPAREWLMEVIFNRVRADEMPVFRIDNPDILGMFGLEAGTKKYFSYNDLDPYLFKIQEQARKIDQDQKRRTPYEGAINTIYGNLIQYQQLTQTVYPLRMPGTVQGYYDSVAATIMEAAAKMQAGESMAQEDASPRLRMYMQQLREMSNSPLFLLHVDGDWQKIGDYLTTGIPAAGKVPEPAVLLANLAHARQTGNQADFLFHAQELASMAPADTGEHPDTEYYFNQAQPFIVSLSLYVLVMLLVFVGWLFSPKMYLPTAYWILLITFILHTYGLGLRVVITGYAPVTNLYSSAVAVGWVATGLSLIFEHFQKKGLGSLAAATIGFLTLLVAHHLSDSGDTMEKMRAVLNSNFWLTTHVITITMGYGATFLAGFLGIIYIVYGWINGRVPKDTHNTFHWILYGSVCFALLFSFVGTVLGGIWADQSWGRFWGWDPKENGALMIVLWTAMILHALRSGMVKTRGLVNLSIGGNVITAWSWFGTNMLGVGLHSYGFMNSAFFWLVMFWFSQFAIILLEWLFPVKVAKAETA
ncbi:MAG: cytochrome c biogenesis protein [Puniceicoccaceae bacterium]